MNGKESEESFGELQTLGYEETLKPERPAPEGPSWTALGLSEAETLKPSVGGIVDDGRTDGARRWRPGETILGRYVVEKELGQGGMGVVYGCLDKVGGVRVAVKCLPPELSHNSVEMEEVRENYQLVYGLSHPNIAGVRQLERDEKGEYFLVMEVAEGESLRRWLREKWKAGGVSLKEAVGVLRQVASALDYAHGRKVVHRDVKPGNVMIDGKGDVKVLDFGLADQIRTSLSRASHVHRGTSGTGPYMSPEQWRGRPQDGKTDQYALGVMAYEMLAGRLPFGNCEMSVLREVVLKEEPEEIPGVPEGAMAAIRRAMAKNAAERFPACGAFVDALESAASHGGAGRGGASRPGEPVKGRLAGTAAGRSAGDAAGKAAETTDCRDGSPHQGTTGPGAGGGGMFLQKVRVERTLEEAWREKATAGEKAELEKIREVFAAGEEALKAGEHAVAAGLFGQCEPGLEKWRKAVAERKERERAAAAAQQAEERRRLEERKARERAEEAARKEAERKRVEEKAARRRAKRKKILFGVLFGVLVLFAVLAVGHMADKRAQKLIAKAKAEIAALPMEKTTGTMQTCQELVGLMKKRVALENKKAELILQRGGYDSLWYMFLWLIIAVGGVFVGLFMFREGDGLQILAVMVWLVALGFLIGSVGCLKDFYNDMNLKEISQVEHQLKMLDRQVVALMSIKPKNANE